MEKKLNTELFKMAPEGGCGCNDTAGGNAEEAPDVKKILNVELLVIDLTSCARCVPTGGQLKQAVGLLAPVAEALGIELKHREIASRRLRRPKTTH